MTAVSHDTGHAAGSHRQFPHLVAHQFRADLRCFPRNKGSVFWTLALPILFLVIFGSVFQHPKRRRAGRKNRRAGVLRSRYHRLRCHSRHVSNLIISVVRYRETGIYKRRRATPLPASAVIAARSLVAALSVLAITAVLVAIGWAAFAAHIPGRTGPAFLLDIIVGAVVFSCLGFAVASLISSIDAAQPVTLAIILPLCFLSGVFIPILELPHWLIDVGKIFPVHALADALLAAYNPHTTGLGLRWGDLVVLAAWGAAGLIIALRRFSWLPRAG
jgi:ABC-2 type transport system permease protein